MASEAQKQARKRRKERHRLLMEAGKKAAAMVAKEEASPVVPSALTAGPEAATAEPAVG